MRNEYTAPTRGCSAVPDRKVNIGNVLIKGEGTRRIR